MTTDPERIAELANAKKSPPTVAERQLEATQAIAIELGRIRGELAMMKASAHNQADALQKIVAALGRR